MTNALNRSVADVFDTYVYFVGITQGAYSYCTAVGLFKSLVGIVLIFGTNWLSKRFNQTRIVLMKHVTTPAADGSLTPSTYVLPEPDRHHHPPAVHLRDRRVLRQ